MLPWKEPALPDMSDTRNLQQCWLAIACHCHAGMRIVPIGVDRNGNINMAELKEKAEANKNE
jgi:hypothetical protein